MKIRRSIFTTSSLEKDLLDLPTIVKVIKETKVGQGINFLPRTIKDLRANLPHLISDLIGAAGLSSVRNELAANLKQLLHRKGIL